MKHRLATISVLVFVLLVPFFCWKSASALSPDTTVATTAHVTAGALSARVQSSWPWYVTRASGFTAAILLLLLILSGIGQLTGFTYRFLEPLVSWSLHRAIAIAFGAAVLVHGSVLLLDHFVPFTIMQVVFPFASHYQPAVIFGMHLGSLYVAYGIVAGYIALILIATSLFWVNTKPAWWRSLHYLSYALFVLVFLHGLYVGTDIAHGAVRLVWWVAGGIIGLGILSRLRRAWTIRQLEKTQ